MASVSLTTSKMYLFCNQCGDSFHLADNFNGIYAPGDGFVNQKYKRPSLLGRLFLNMIKMFFKDSIKSKRYSLLQLVQWIESHAELHGKRSILIKTDIQSTLDSIELIRPDKL